MTRTRVFLLFGSLAALAMITGGVVAQRGPGRPMGRGPRGAGPHGAGQDTSFDTDHDVFHFLLTKGDKIRRQVKNLDNGIETLTESDDPVIAAKIQQHVAAMYERLEENRPIHMRDPLFRELFRHAEKIELKATPTEKGMRVVETSQDPYVVKLLHEHAKVVSLFIKNGHAEASKNHAVPSQTGDKEAAASEAESAATGCCQKSCQCAGVSCSTRESQTGQGDLKCCNENGSCRGQES